MSDPAPLSWHTLTTVWEMPPAAAILLATAAALYLAGVCMTPGWSLQCTAWFYAAIAIAAVAMGGSINVYSGVLFSMHMAQHLLLIMVVPALIVLSRPLELARRTATERVRRAITRTARSRVVAVATHPMVTFAYYAAVVVGTHLTSFQQTSLTHGWAHGLEETLYLSSGYLLLLPVLETEPISRPMPQLMRLITLLFSMGVDTIVGITLLMTQHELFPAYATVDRASMAMS